LAANKASARLYNSRNSFPRSAATIPSVVRNRVYQCQSDPLSYQNALLNQQIFTVCSSSDWRGLLYVK
jgi:hypothetical protein